MRSHEARQRVFKLERLEAPILVRKEGLLPNYFRFLPKTRQNSQILHPAFRCHRSMSPPFGPKKCSKRPTSQFPKSTFFPSDGKQGASASRFARFRRKQARRARCSRFPFSATEMLASSIPLSLSPLSPLRHRSLLDRKSAQKRPSSRLSEDFVLHTIFCFSPKHGSLPRLITRQPGLRHRV